MGQAALRRRDLSALALAGALSPVSTLTLQGCGERRAGLDAAIAQRLRILPGGWVGGANSTRGHRLRQAAPAWPQGQTPRRAQVLVLGAGIAGLACARRLQARGVDVALLELEDQPGGNSRGHQLGGQPCPMGAHYLPLPGPEAHEVQQLLQELGLARHEMGRWVYEERHLCHSPQERLFFEGQWHEGLLPPAQTPAQGAQYQRFAQLVQQARADLGFAMPSQRAPWRVGHQQLDAQSFSQWLNSQQLDAAPLRWYLDYCCRDDFGAPAAEVSAWAGLHYFGSRHGFMSMEEREAVLTWPEGNAWLARRLAAPLQGALHTGRSVLRLREERHQVQVLAWDEARQRPERWVADQVVLALPLFIARRLVEQPPAALHEAADAMAYAPWLVANLLLDAPPLERLGVPPAWDNVVYGSQALGYVNAAHQRLDPRPGPQVWTSYRALPRSQRSALLQPDWQPWAAQVLAELAALHPDLLERLQRMDLVRWGHAMSIPRPGLRGHAGLAALRERAHGRLQFAHADLAGYSVFEEAFTLGEQVAARLLAQRRA
jgi:monoamine oxidase